MTQESKLGRFIVTPWFIYFLIQLSKSDEILEVSSQDDKLIVDQQEPADMTKLPNSHSAALVMAFIFFCVLAYGAYRLFKYKCGKRKQPLTVSLGPGKSEDPEDLQGMEDYIKEREDYLAIYGPKSNVNTISGAVSKMEQV